MSLAIENLREHIFTVRAQKVIIDSDVAALFEIDTRHLNQQVSRSCDRVPESFVFQLEQVEFEDYVTKVPSAAKDGPGGRRFLPFVFTERGIIFFAGTFSSSKTLKLFSSLMDIFLEGRNNELLNDFGTQSTLASLSFSNKRIENTLSDINSHMLFLRSNLVTNTLTAHHNSHPRYFKKEQLAASVSDQLQTMVQIVSDHFKISPQELMKKSRKPFYVIPRQIAIYLIRDTFGTSFRDIGEYFGGRDHTTILHAYEKTTNALTANISLRETIEKLLALYQLKNTSA